MVELVELKSRARYWLIRADGGKYYDHFKYQGFISIHLNEVSLEKLQSSELLLTKTKTIDFYKNQIADIYSDKEWTKHKVTFSATTLYSFVEDMSIGDYVVVPSHKSNYFLIGEISSDVYEAEQQESNVNYSLTNDKKRRTVRWINEVPRHKMNSKFLYSTLTMHRSIIEVTKYAHYIDGLISPLYYKDGKLNLRLTVNTKNSITSSMWQSLYSVIEEKRNKEIEEEIIATANVESPGELNLQSVVQFLADNSWIWQSGLAALATLFGEVDIKGIKIKGVFPYLRDRKPQQLEIREKTIAVESIEKDVELKDLERKVKIEKARKELQAIRDFDITIDSPSVHYASEDQMQMDFDSTTDEE